jgi:ADP-heptose:LPS heptosyltransferase
MKLDGEGILITRLKSIGDIVFTLPAVHAVRAAFPNQRITFLVSKEFTPLLEGFQDVDDVIGLDRRRVRRPSPFGLLHEVFSLLWRLRRNRFRLAVDFQGYGETAFLTWYTGARERWGMVYRESRRWAYTRALAPERKQHSAEGFLALLKHAGLPVSPVRNEFVLPESALAKAQRFFLESRLSPERPTVLFQPLTSSAGKNWPLERFIAVARASRAEGRQVLFGGGPAEIAALEPVRQAGFPVAAGVPLLVSAGLAKLSQFVVGGDTGLLHLAVAMGKRVVMLMSAIRPSNTYPFGHPNWAVLPPTGEPLAKLDTETVLQACAEAGSSRPTP